MSIADVKAGQAFVELYVRSDKYRKALDAAGQRLQRFGDKVASMGRKLATAGAALAAPLAFGVRSYASLDDALRRVEARSTGTAREMAAVREQAKELGRTTSFTAVQVAELQDILAKRGFTRAEILEQTPAILAFARAAGDGRDAMEDITNAATLSAGVLNAWGLDASQTTTVADLMTAAVNNSALSMGTLRESLSYIAPIAAQSGYNLKDTLQVLGELSNLWIEGSMAGTSFRRMMIELTSQMEELTGKRISVEDGAGGFRDLGDIIADIEAATRGMSKPERLQVFEQIFGARGLAAAAGLSRSSESADRLSRGLENAATEAQRTSEHMDAGLGGALRRLWSATEGVRNAIGESLAQSLNSLLETLTPMLTSMAKWIERNHWAVKTIGLVSAGLVGAGGAMMAFGYAAQAAGVLVATVFAHPLLLTVAAAAAAATAIAALTADVAELSTAMRDAREANDAARAADQDRIDRLRELAQQQSLTSEEMTEAKSLIESLESTYGDLGLAIDETTGKIDGLAGAQEKLNQKMREAVIADLEAEIAEHDANIAEIEAEIQSFWSQFQTQWMGGGARGDALSERARAESAAVQALHDRLTALRDGNAKAQRDAMTGAGAEAKGKGSTPSMSDVAREKASRDVESFNRKAVDRLTQLQIAAIEDERTRRIAAIQERYRKEREEAAKLGANEAVLNAARRQEIANVNAEFDKRAKNRRDEAQRALADEIARAQVAADTSDSRERALAYLEIERRQALREAREAGVSLDDVNRLFDLRRQAVGQADRQPTDVLGTFSSGMISRMGGDRDVTQDQIRDNTARTANVCANGFRDLGRRMSDTLRNEMFGP